MGFSDLKEMFGGRQEAKGKVLKPDVDLGNIDTEDTYHTTTTAYPVGDGDIDEENAYMGEEAEEEEERITQSSIKIANYDTYSLPKLIEVVNLVREDYTVFISFETLVLKYKAMSLDKTEIEARSKAEINQFCNALLGAKIALDATFDKLGEFTYIFAPNGVDVAKLKGESAKEKEAAE